MSIKHILKTYSNHKKLQCEECEKSFDLENMFLIPSLMQCGNSTRIQVYYQLLCKDCFFKEMLKDEETAKLVDNAKYDFYPCPNCGKDIKVKKNICRLITLDRENATCEHCGSQIEVGLALGFLTGEYQEKPIKSKSK
jgi:DNA-directed RNA polymerase subunit RPC12/RpoP